VKGLTSDEVVSSREKYGPNTLTEAVRETFLEKLLGNFKDPMILILCIALVVNVVFCFLGKSEWYEPVGIAAAILIATFVSTLSEFRNESSFKKLQEEAATIKCKVYRDGVPVEVSINSLVTWDRVILQSGDKIPADGILASGELKVEQSALNGESRDVTKISSVIDITKDDRLLSAFVTDTHNQYSVFRGSTVSSGNAEMMVMRVGDNTMLGGIAQAIQEDSDRDTPLAVKLGGLANGISKFGYIGGTLIAIAMLFSNIVVANHFDFNAIASTWDWGTFIQQIVDAVMLAVIIIVMAVPEGLPLMISIVSALNMGKMLKDNVLVRKLAGIETAGSLNILFSDKTGTITKGKLEVVKFANCNSMDGIDEWDKFDNIPSKIRGHLCDCILGASEATVTADKKIIGGNMTDRAVLSYYVKSSPGYKVNAVINRIPFDSAAKFSAAEIESDVYSRIVVMKGAPEIILEKCQQYYDATGHCYIFNSDSRESVRNKIYEYASRSIRVLAFAISDVPGDQSGIVDGSLENVTDWTFVGIVGIRDDVRPEAVLAISEVQSAGVHVVMITGDNKETAMAIATESGIRDADHPIVLTSQELAELSDHDVKGFIPHLSVIARALPNDKLRLVKLAQELNLVVGMTGDGVNDSPALKAADVGFAMGGGTEVAKEASEIIIMDDNFKSIDKAILYGRTIFNSIRKFIIFQLTINVSAVLISLVCPFLGIENPLTITQILWINLIMDTLAALAFGGEPALPRFMQEKPKRRDEPILSKYMISEIATSGVFVFILSLVFILAPFVTNMFRPDPVGDISYHMTGYFAFFVFAAVFNAFNARTEKMNLFDSISSNKGFLKVIGLITVVQVALVYVGGKVFGCHGLSLKEWAVVLGFAILIIPIDILRKVICSKIKVSQTM
jgi:calcium-translocating P-type ATPase